MDMNRFGSKYQVIHVGKTEDGKKWHIEIGICRDWPLSWVDHLPWEKFPRQAYPVRTFVGVGLSWFEIVDGVYMFPGVHTPVLNAIVSTFVIDKVR